jgi:phosphoglycerate dehydrogenase-like enzyme
MKKPIKARPVQLVVADAAPDEIVEFVADKFPHVEAHACRSGEDLCRVIDRFKPNVAFINKSGNVAERHWRHLFASKDISWINIGHVGFDHVPNWSSSQVSVTNSGGVSAEAMAEYVIAAITLINTKFNECRRNQDMRTWNNIKWTPLRGKTLVTVGVGNVGLHVIKKARALGLKVVAVRNSPKPLPGAYLTYPITELKLAFAHADFISLQIPLNEQTRHLINADAIAGMQPTAWLINTARGAIVDEKALVAAAREYRIGGAVLDVFETEPLPQDSELWQLDNVVVTPHMSGNLPGFRQELISMFCANLRRFRLNLPLKNVISCP